MNLFKKDLMQIDIYMEDIKKREEKVILIKLKNVVKIVISNNHRL